MHWCCDHASKGREHHQRHDARFQQLHKVGKARLCRTLPTYFAVGPYVGHGTRFR
jgi:hypothetical protein